MAYYEGSVIRLEAEEIPEFIGTSDEGIEKLLRESRYYFKVLATCDVAYGRLDYPRLVQTFVQQMTDFYPALQKVKGFLRFWEEELYGPLRNVTIGLTRDIPGQNIIAESNILTLQ